MDMEVLLVTKKKFMINTTTWVYGLPNKMASEVQILNIGMTLTTSAGPWSKLLLERREITRRGLSIGIWPWIEAETPRTVGIAVTDVEAL